MNYVARAEAEILSLPCPTVQQFSGLTDAEVAVLDRRIEDDRARRWRMMQRRAPDLSDWVCPDIKALELTSWHRERTVRWTPFQRDYSGFVREQPKKIEKRLRDISVG